MSMPVLSSVSKALTLLDAFSAEKPRAHPLRAGPAGRRAQVLRLPPARPPWRPTASWRRALPGAATAWAGSSWSWPAACWRRYELRELAAPFMEELAEKSGEIVHLSILDGAADRVPGQARAQPAADRVHHDRRAQPGPRLGHGQGAAGGPARRRAPAGAGGQAPGALHAYHHHGPTPARRASWKPSAAWATPWTDEETFPGIRCVAAPLRDGEGRGAGGHQRHRAHPAHGRAAGRREITQMGHGHRRPDLREDPARAVSIYRKEGEQHVGTGTAEGRREPATRTGRRRWPATWWARAPTP